MPKRKENLVLKPMDDEVIAYDPETQLAFCLNRTAASVLENCEVETSVQTLLGHVGDAPGSKELLELTLNELASQGLITGHVSSGLSRRSFLAKWGKVAAALPLVAMVSVPTPAAAASGVQDFADGLSFDGDLPTEDPIPGTGDNP